MKFVRVFPCEHEQPEYNLHASILVPVDKIILVEANEEKDKGGFIKVLNLAVWYYDEYGDAQMGVWHDHLDTAAEPLDDIFSDFVKRLA